MLVGAPKDDQAPLRHHMESGTVVVFGSTFHPTPIEIDHMTILNSMRALAAVAMASTIVESERSAGTFIIRTNENEGRPTDDQLHALDEHRRRRNREQERAAAEYDQKAAGYRAERLARKAASFAKRLPRSERK